MNIEKVKEIKKALECCIVHGQCDCCIFREKHPFACLTEMHKQLLTLINELESENERLKKENQLFINEQINRLKERKNVNIKDIDVCKAQKNRIAELEKKNKDYHDRLNNAQTYIDNHEEIWKLNTEIKLKQFAEMLKKQMYEGEVLGHKCKLAVYRDIDIDEALKECLNDRN